MPEIFIEPGRGLSAMAGVTIDRVIQVKPSENNLDKSIITLSTGKFSAGLFNVGNGFSFYSKTTDGSYTILSDTSKKADVYGKACASFDKPKEGDFYISSALKSGDIVVITGTGAYSGEMTTKWCSKQPPTDIIIDE